MEVQRFNQSFEELVALLDNPAGMIVRYAVLALGELSDNRAIEPLLKVFTKQCSGVAKMAAVEIVSKVDEEKAINFLWQIACNSEYNEATRRMATFPLAKISSDSQALLFEGLQNPNKGVRRAVMGGLSKLGNDAAVEALTKALETETYHSLRRSAITALGYSGNPRAIAPIFKVLENSTDHCRTEAIAILGYTDNPAVIPVLAKVLLEDKDWGSRAWAATSLGVLKFEQVTQFLLKGLLEDKYSTVRVNCAWALYYHTDEPIAQELIFALSDSVALIRAEVASLLGSTNDPQAIQPLLKVAQNERETVSVREKAIHSLGELKALAAKDFLLDLLTHKKGLLRAASVEALGNLGELDIFESLAKALNDRFPAARQNTIAALAKLKHPNTVQVFLERLKSERLAKVQADLVEALGELGDKRAVEPLLKELSHSKNKDGVLCALGKLGDAQACSAIANFLQDEDEEIHRAAVFALAKLGDSRGIEGVIYLLRDYSYYTRYEAIEILAELGEKAAAALPTLDWLSQHDSNEIVLYEVKGNTGQLTTRTTVGQAAARAMEKIFASLANIQANLE